MHKTTFIIILALLLIPLNLLHAAQEALGLSLASPLDYQVFQRRTVDEGTIIIRGSILVEADEWQCRVMANGGDPARTAWENIKSPAAGGKIALDLKAKPGAGWYRVEVRGVKDGKTVAEAAVEHVGLGEVFIVAGQSNAANHGSEKQVTKSQLVSSFDGKQWSIANDPQHGASGNGGSFIPAFGDAMTARYGVPIGIVPVAVGSTSVREWLPKGVRFKQNTTTGKGVVAKGDEFESDGVLFAKLCQPMKALGIGGFRAVIWHQGESDAGQSNADRQISGAQYVEFMEKLIRTSRNQAAWPVPWFTAVATFHSEQEQENTEFRNAMKSLWSKGLSWEGVDTDALRGDLRAGVHFNGQGLQKHGQLWAEKVGAWLDDQIAPPRDGPPSKDYKMVWSDEFDGAELDPKKWQHRSLGKRNEAFISADCSKVDGKGKFIITPMQKGSEYHGGMVSTQKTQQWTRGYFECRLQVTTEPGLNTAFWLQSDNISALDRGKGTPDDTQKNGAEVDICEYIARQGEVAHFNIHWNGYGKLHRSMPSDAFVPGLREGLHTYGVEWTESGYTFFIDGRRIWQTNEAISGTPQYIILSVEISQWAGGIETAKLPTSAVFDWVRVWQK
jgi:Glycosyl hydrolases family 16/Carbohydrate esterase, sialic acid-specific acetylesterase